MSVAYVGQVKVKNATVNVYQMRERNSWKPYACLQLVAEPEPMGMVEVAKVNDLTLGDLRQLLIETMSAIEGIASLTELLSCLAKYESDGKYCHTTMQEIEA